MIETTVSRHIEILFIGADEQYARLTESAIRTSQAVINLHTVTSGDEVIDLISGERIFTEIPRPDLIILDFDFAGDLGEKVLRELKGKEGTKRIPVVVLTRLHSSEEIYGIYSMHANCCISKPARAEQFTPLLRTIENFWLNIVRLPSEL